MAPARRWTGPLAWITVVAACMVVWAAGTDTAPPPDFGSSLDDVFFADAREQLGPGQPGLVPAGTAATGGGMAPAAGGATPDDSAGAAGADVAWSTLISPDSLESEIKSLVQPLADVTKLPTEFKAGGHRQARVVFTHLALVFGVINDYPGDVRWKDKANGLRRLFSQSAANCKTASDAAYKDAQLRAQDLADLVRGGNVEVPNADPLDSWAQAGDIPPIMQRMEQGRSEKLKRWTGSEAEFSKNRSDALREAEILAVLAEIIKDQEFEYGGDDTFAGYADELREQSRAIGEAVKQSNFSNAQSSTAKMSQACDTCHGDYRG